MDSTESRAKNGNMAKGNILVVDDNPNNLRILVGMLSDRGYKVRPASSGPLALRSVQLTLPDLILLDIKMPDMDGYEVCRRLKSDDLTGDVPIIFISALHETIDKIKAFGVGGVDYITKPFQIEEVLARVETHIAMGNMQKRLADQNAQLRREVIERKWVEEALQIAHAELEKRVEERTAELAGTGKKLREEIVERKQAEKERAKMERLFHRAQKMEAMGALAGGIAHDFNNILFPIMGYAEMLLESIPEDSSAQSSLKAILQASFRARILIQQILAFGRQDGQEKKPLIIQPIVKEALKLIRASLPATIEIRENINKACGPVLVEPTKIHQVVMNLCTNAYHAMQETGGILEVNMDEVARGPDDLVAKMELMPGKYLQLIVKDTGHGIKPNVMERIFDPYYTTKDTDKGTGLGLAVVYGIVSSYGGDISVSSKPGEGSVFTIYLPLIDTIAEEPEITYPDAAPTGKENILLIDDEAPIGRMVYQMLEVLGYQVTSQASGIEALEVFRAQPDKFDLVITDMTMPNMTGVELSKMMMKIRSDIPIVLCSGFSEQVNEKSVKSLGIKALLTKPFEIKEVAETIREVLA